jgi:predicted alpha/beta superfamily hydrolase
MRRWGLLCLILVLVVCGRSQTKTFVVHVVIPATTPQDASVFIAGNMPALGEWNPGKVRLQKVNDSVWSYSGTAFVGDVLEFKITRGTWPTEAIYVDGAIPQNTIVRVLSDTVLVLKPVAWNDLSGARKRQTSANGITGTVRYHRGLSGEGLKYDRDVIVWLPPSYERDTQRRYPVLYMHDGQNVFDPSTSFLGADWRADEVADSLIRTGAIEEIIIVAVNNSPDRMSEYSDAPTGRTYAKFVVERLKPLIDSTYRTKPSAENTAVMGSSLGGLVSLCFVWWYPEVFSKAGCLSSTVIPGSREEILKEIRAYAGPRKKVRLYFDVGGMERGLLSGFKALSSTLKEKGYEEGKDLEFFLDEGAVHNEIAWSHRLWRPMTFLFGRK